MAKIKQKSKSGAKKRFQVTGSGRIKRGKAGNRHINEHKNAKRGRRLRGVVTVDQTNVAEVKRMLLL